jgi:hypothetical protein
VHGVPTGGYAVGQIVGFHGFCVSSLERPGIAVVWVSDDGTVSQKKSGISERYE